MPSPGSPIAVSPATCSSMVRRPTTSARASRRNSWFGGIDDPAVFTIKGPPALELYATLFAGARRDCHACG